MTTSAGSPPLDDDYFICNGCGAPSSPTEEHLVHRDIARVLLAAPKSPRRDVRPSLEGGFFSGFVHSNGQNQSLGRVNFNAAIDNLLCGECNRHKAGPLEAQAGKALQSFLVDGAVADFSLLRRWAWYFALKFWWYKRPTEDLRAGVLFPVLSTLFREGSSVDLRVRVADLAADHNLYSYMWVAESDGAFFKYAMWVTRGLVWIVLPSSLLLPMPEPVSRVPTVELMNVRRSDLPRIRPRNLAALPAVENILADKRIGEAISVHAGRP